MLEIDLPRLRMSRSFLQDLSKAVCRFPRGTVAGNHRQHFFDPTGLYTITIIPDRIEKNDRLILRRGSSIANYSGQKLMRTYGFSADCKSNCIRIGLRPFIMRSDSELLIYIFRSEKRMGMLMQTDFAKSDGIKSDLRTRWPKSSDFGPKSDDPTHQIIKSKNGLGLQSSKNLVERSRYSSSARYTQKYEYEYE